MQQRRQQAQTAQKNGGKQKKCAKNSQSIARLHAAAFVCARCGANTALSTSNVLYAASVACWHWVWLVYIEKRFLVSFFYCCFCFFFFTVHKNSYEAYLLMQLCSFFAHCSACHTPFSCSCHYVATWAACRLSRFRMRPVRGALLPSPLPCQRHLYDFNSSCSCCCFYITFLHKM